MACLDATKVHFVLDGEYLSPMRTIAQCDLQEDEVVDAFLEELATDAPRIV